MEDIKQEELENMDVVKEVMNADESLELQNILTSLKKEAEDVTFKKYVYTYFENKYKQKITDFTMTQNFINEYKRKYSNKNNDDHLILIEIYQGWLEKKEKIKAIKAIPDPVKPGK